jgi:hypothetical protein
LCSSQTRSQGLFPCRYQACETRSRIFNSQTPNSKAHINEAEPSLHLDTMAFYRQLDRSKEEVRMLVIVDPPEGSSPDQARLVHCKLEHVDLDDYTPGFANFLKEMNYSNQPLNTLLQSWLQNSDHGWASLHEYAADKLLPLPMWRWILDYSNVDEALETWEELMEAIGTTSANCPRIPSEPRPAASGLAKLTAIRVQMKFRTFDFRARFRWGDFEAISYCWESDVRDRTIIVDGIPFDVPTNLEALLQSLRTLPDVKSGMKFWVDALCINQNDTSERNHQVRFMKSIYSKAFAVIVWLGSSMDGSAKAIDFMASMAQLTMNEDAHKGCYFDPRKWKADDQGEMQKKRFSELPWEELLNFLNRSYWRRLWVVQELALNHNMTLFLCGDRQLSRSMISRTCYFCECNIGIIDHLVSPSLQLESTSPSTMYGSIWPTVYHVNKLLGIRDQGMVSMETRLGSVDVVLDLSRKANVTDARDKVYGILGILPRELSDMITPNYEKSNSVDQVYYQFAHKMLQEYKRLDSILSWCCYKPNDSLPSWIPDWTSRFSRNHVQWLKQTRASGLLDGHWSISQQGRRLNTPGIILDHIQSSSSSQSENLPFRTQQPRLVVDMNDTKYSHRCGDLDQLSAALKRTLVMHHPGTRDRKNSILDIYWVDWDKNEAEESLKTMQKITQNLCWESFDSFRQTNANFFIFGHKFQDFFPKMQTSTTYEQIEDEFEKESVSNMLIAVLALIGRRLITTQGGYLGLAPEEVQENDAIAILYGCNFPVILRPHGDEYLLIGECYIDGIMNGEIIEAKERGGIQYEEVEISIC